MCAISLRPAIAPRLGIGSRIDDSAAWHHRAQARAGCWRERSRRQPDFEGSLGTQSVRLFDYVVARTGFHDRDAANAGFDPVSVDSMVWDHKVHYPGAKEMTIRVTGDRGTGRLLGAQIIGHFGTEVSKQIHIFAAAIHHGMNVEQVNDFDLSYTPPLSSPWIPVQMPHRPGRSARRRRDPGSLACLNTVSNSRMVLE